MLSLAILLILCLSSFASLSSAAGASDEAMAVTDQDVDDSYRTRLGGTVWAWASYADGSGLVDAIVLFEPGSDDVSARGRVLGQVEEAASETKSDSGGLASAGLVREFVYSVDGFSARLSVDTIESMESSEPGVILYPDLQLNATYTDGVSQIGADQLWTRTDSLGLAVTGQGIVVAVIDTGIDYTHPDLGGGIGPTYKVIGGYDFVNDDDDPMDDNGHGTHVAGTIAADGDLPGVAPGAKLLAYKILGAGGVGSMSDAIAAIDAAMDPNGDGLTADHADIISMSLGGPGDTDDPVCLAVENAVEAGITVVVAAGNSGPSLGTVGTPGLAPSVITVGAVDGSGALASFSSRGPTTEMAVKPEISAPGVDILSTVPYSGATFSSPSGYAALSGTSMATPHVSGAAALLLQLHPDWTPVMLKSAIVSLCKDVENSLWAAGAGQVWLPSAANATMFSSVPLVSYGLAGSPSVSITILNDGAGATFATSSVDLFSLNPNGSLPEASSADLSSTSPVSLFISAGGVGSVTLTVPTVPLTAKEGYYAGELVLSSAAREIRVPFGFVVLSTLEVHVYDMGGNEVFDPYGGVWVYDIPDASYAVGYRGYVNPVPPATFFLPSGDYSVHAIGHQLIYTFTDPYVLSDTVTVGRLSTVRLDLRMSDAHALAIDLETEDGQPIYVKDYRVYCRHEGTRNISFDLTGSDYSVVGSEVFSIPHSRTVYVSDTDATVGISIAGFSYTPGMWSFMNLNWQHWYEYVSGSSTAFMVEASADLQYLLAWELDGVGSDTPSALTWDAGTSAVFDTKYDIPGTILSPWCNWGTHRSAGGDATFFVRRDTDTSLNPFFSGMTRTTVVMGTFTELYFPGSVVGGYSERQYFVADYDHLVESSSSDDILLPDRNYLEPLSPGITEETLGSGPFYPSLFTDNTEAVMVLHHPLLRDQSDARVGGMYVPSMYLYKGGSLVGIYQLSEYLARPDSVRVIDLFDAGTYVAEIDYQPTSQISSSVHMELGFSVPSTDMDPPAVTGMQMSQRFVPGEAVPVSFDISDASSSVTVALSWRAGSADSWKSLTVASSSGTYSASVPTAASTATIDLLLVATDASGNFLSSSITTAAMARVPVEFTIAPLDGHVEYKDAAVSVVLQGALESMSGEPLSPTAAVPLELFVGGEKVAMVLDEYVLGTSHTHDGRIQFEWLLNPTVVFSGPNETVGVTVSFDLGVYEPVTRTFTLTSSPSVATPPTLSLVSPADGSLVAAGTVIDLSVSDDGLVQGEYSVDDGAWATLSQPWDVDTSAWSDGIHTLEVSVRDDDGLTEADSFSFEIDASSPSLVIVQPLAGTKVPMGFVLEVSVYDAHLSAVTYSVDDGPSAALPSPYTVDMTGWSVGAHHVDVAATDSVGHESIAMTYFEIVDSPVVVSLISPADGASIRSGTPIALSVLGTGSISCTWSEGVVAVALAAPYEIPTTGWAEGVHVVTVEASDSEGDSYELTFSVTIDDTMPRISLLWPVSGAYVTPDRIVSFTASDINLAYVNWSINGVGQSTESATVTVSLSFVGVEGSFPLRVLACDAAGNTAEDSFIFIMDLYDPVVLLEGIPPSGAIAPGVDLEVSASDSSLEGVTLSVDGGTAFSAYPGMVFDTEGLSLGKHTLTLYASDLADRFTVVEADIYIDGTAPDVSAPDGLTYAPGEPLTVTVDVADDFGVATCTLRYELPDGGYSELPMSVLDGVASGVVPAASLWDGMDMYVLAVDFAGNTAESESIVAEVSPGIDGGAGSLLTSAVGMLSLGLLAAAAVALSVIVLVRRRDAPRPCQSYSTHDSRPSARPATQAVRPASTPAAAKAAAAPAHMSSPVLRSAPLVHAAAVVAASVPRIQPPSAAPAAGPAVEPDYGALIERELVEGIERRSAYHGPAVPRAPARADEPLSQSEATIINALRLKMLMDGEVPDGGSIF